MVNTQTVYESFSVYDLTSLIWTRVSFDDATTLKQKAEFASSLCLGGTFAWALDLGGPGTMRPPGMLEDDMGLEGADPDGSNSGSGAVYISPKIYDESNPDFGCIPPCEVIMPPRVLDKPTTMSFPPYETSLEVAWWETSTTMVSGTVSTSTWLEKTVQTTTLTIPPLTTTAIGVWNWNITGVNSDKSTKYTLTESIHPPPFVITHHPPRKTGNGPENDTPGTTSNGDGKPDVTSGDDNEPEPTRSGSDDDDDNSNESSTDDRPIPTSGSDTPPETSGENSPEPGETSHPPYISTRTVTPPFQNPHTTETDGMIILPVMTFSPGPPNPTCTANCGKPCRGRDCDKTCGDCGSGDKDFNDPNSPDPPRRHPGCIGGDCKGGSHPTCSGPFCLIFKCLGSGCHKDVCLNPAECIWNICTPDKSCIPGCVGPHCSNKRCTGDDCIAWGCTGKDCGPKGCKGPRCEPLACKGRDCKGGVCIGPKCEKVPKDEECEAKKAPQCTEMVSEVQTKKSPKEYSTTTRTHCSTVTACSIEPTTTTSTKTIDGKQVITITDAYTAHQTLSDNNKKALLQRVMYDIKSRRSLRNPQKTTSSPGSNPTMDPPGSGVVKCGGERSLDEVKVSIAMHDFCSSINGTILDADKPDSKSTQMSYSRLCDEDHPNECFLYPNWTLKVEAINGCSFKIDTDNYDSSLCVDNFMLILDKCTRAKATVENNCARFSVEIPRVGQP